MIVSLRRAWLLVGLSLGFSFAMVLLEVVLLLLDSLLSFRRHCSSSQRCAWVSFVMSALLLDNLGLNLVLGRIRASVGFLSFFVDNLGVVFLVEDLSLDASSEVAAVWVAGCVSSTVNVLLLVLARLIDALLFLVESSVVVDLRFDS